MEKEITAEEFFRNKLKALKPNETQITLSLHKIDAETAMRWAYEYSLLSPLIIVAKEVSEMWQTKNPNKEKYLMCSNLITTGMPKNWIELWQQIEIWYGDIKQQETAEQLLNRIIPRLLSSLPSHEVKEGEVTERLIKERHRLADRNIELLEQIDKISNMSSEEIIGRVRDRHKELKSKGWDYTAFYNGWLEGRVDLLQHIKLSSPKSEGKELSEITDEDIDEIEKMGHVIFKKNEARNWIKVRIATGSLPFQIYQYLQSKGYKLPKYY